MPLRRLHPGHGPILHSARERAQREFSQHRRRCRRVIGILEEESATAFEIGRKLWQERIVREQPLLVVWEVLGHLDLMLAMGIARERPDADGHWRYSLARGGRAKSLEEGRVHAC